VSRAFVKEDDGVSEVVAPRPQRQHPYYVTPEGYAHLQEGLAQAQAGGNEREVELLQERLEAAIVVDPQQQARDVVAFGASVTVETPDGKQQTYRIVGEDEADPLSGTISWISPLAQALLEHRAGDRVVWERPAGNVPVRIVSISYAV
jgi:transcription elongation GreA/GreB family factor